MQYYARLSLSSKLYGTSIAFLAIKSIISPDKSCLNKLMTGTKLVISLVRLWFQFSRSFNKGSFQKKTTKHMENSISQGGSARGHFPYVITILLKCIKSHFKPFQTLLFFSLMTPLPLLPPSQLNCKIFLSIFGILRGKNEKSQNESEIIFRQ